MFDIWHLWQFSTPIRLRLRSVAILVIFTYETVLFSSSSSPFLSFDGFKHLFHSTFDSNADIWQFSTIICLRLRSNAVLVFFDSSQCLHFINFSLHLSLDLFSSILKKLFLLWCFVFGFAYNTFRFQLLRYPFIYSSPAVYNCRFAYRQLKFVNAHTCHRQIRTYR